MFFMGFGRIIGWIFLIIGLCLVFAPVIKFQSLTSLLSFLQINSLYGQLFGGLLAIVGIIIIKMEKDERSKKEFLIKE